MTDNRNTTDLHLPEMAGLAHEELRRVQGGRPSGGQDEIEIRSWSWGASFSTSSTY